jgi:hypothetical protein
MRAWACIVAAVSLLGAADAPAPRSIAVRGTALALEVLPMPGDAGRSGVQLGRTEVPWELLDAFVHEKVDPAPAAVDAVARPSKPYISMDRGFGHAGFPAISVNIDTARAFCVWLSKATGRTVRLPTVDELRATCAAGASGALDARAWHAGNSKGATHRVGSALADANGFHDLQGNVAEWAIDADGKAVLWGGSFLDQPKDLACDRVRAPSEDWNASDPQMPPSRWWLADGPFIGFRVAVEPSGGDNVPQAASPATKEKADGSKPAAP